MPSEGRPKNQYHGQWIAIKPEAKLWVGLCDSWVHAFATWLHLLDRDGWFIVKSSEYKLVTSGEGGWFHLQEPKPMRANTAHTQYRGPLSAKDVAIREKNRLREAQRRKRAFHDVMPPWRKNVD